MSLVLYRETLRVPCLILIALLAGSCNMAETQSGGGIAKANELVEQFGRTKGVRGARLDAQNDRSFGECGFRYDPQLEVLAARVLLGKAFRAESTDESKDNVRKVVRALNDPAQLRNTFELSGGRIFLDENNRMLYLVKEFSIRSMTNSRFHKEMEDLLDLGATWQIRWLAWAGSIVHGNAPPPGLPLPVTRKNDHLHTEPRR